MTECAKFLLTWIEEYYSHDVCKNLETKYRIKIDERGTIKGSRSKLLRFTLKNWYFILKLHIQYFIRKLNSSILRPCYTEELELGCAVTSKYTWKEAGDAGGGRKKYVVWRVHKLSPLKRKERQVR